MSAKVCFGLIFASCLMWPIIATADLEIINEVVITPKTGSAAGNIGSVGQSTTVSMDDAQVDITVGDLESATISSILVETVAKFSMRNTGDNDLLLTVGFPVSNSRYSAFELKDFTVHTNGEERSVFNRITGYPNVLEHTHVSGPSISPDTLPDESNKVDLLGLDHGSFGPWRSMQTNSDQKSLVDSIIESRDAKLSKKLAVHNMMVWKEEFAAQQTRVVEVQYAMKIPVQKNEVQRRPAESNKDGIWSEQANNCPVELLSKLKLKSGAHYYFFDYFLVSGASWNGAIGKEEIRLHLPESWKGQYVFCSAPERLKKVDPVTWVYTLENEEPAENLYFALPSATNK